MADPTSNIHAELDDNNLHVAKGFVNAVNGYSPFRNEKGEQGWQPRMILPNALELVASNATPPTEVDGDVYLIGSERGTLTISEIIWQSGNTVQYVFSGTPNLSAYAAGDYLIVADASNDTNNGTFLITDVNDGSDYIEVTNILVTDATYDESGSGTATSTFADWDGCPYNSWVKYSAIDDQWFFIEPTLSVQCYNIDKGAYYRYDGSGWVASSSLAFGKPEVIQFACSDEDTALTTGTSKISFRMPFAMTLSAVRASLVTAQATDGGGGIFTVDINEGGTTILSTKITIDNTEKTSTTAVTPAVISDSALADDAEITVDIDQIGDGTAKGLKIILIGTRN